MRAATGVGFYQGILTAGLAVLALGASCKKKPKTTACDQNTDCAAGLKCVNRQCVECATKADCRDGMACRDGACVAACIADADCPVGTSCIAGECKSCVVNDECGPGGTCESGTCKRAAKCSSDDDCADDEDCVAGYCQKTAGTSSSMGCSLNTILFSLDSDAIPPDQRDTLEANKECIDKNVPKVLLVIGHTDDSGTDEYNIALSERRSQTVANFLSRLGIDPARLHLVGKGEAEPSGQDDKSKDRRVEFEWQ